jgi:hypothetical protein
VKDVVDVAMMWKGSMGKPDGRRGGRGWIGESWKLRSERGREEWKRREKKREEDENERRKGLEVEGGRQ